MHRKTPLTIISLLLIISGCALQQSPRAELVAGYTAFNATVETLTELRNNDQLGVDEIEDLTALIHLGMRYLTEWEQAVLMGEKNPKAIAGFKFVMEQLLERKKHHE
jgi:hypothetical protein